MPEDKGFIRLADLERSTDALLGEVYAGNDVTRASLWFWSDLDSDKGIILFASVRIGERWVVGSETSGRHFSPKSHYFIRLRKDRTSLIHPEDLSQAGSSGIILTVRVAIVPDASGVSQEVSGYPREVQFRIVPKKVPVGHILQGRRKVS